MRASLSRVAAAAAAGLTLFALTAAPVAAQGLSGSQEALERAGKQAFGAGAVDRSIEDVVGTVIEAFLSVMGVLFLALTVYGGYLWMNARGNEQQVEKAKTLLTQAVIGLAIVLAAYVLTRFVIQGVFRATTGAEESSAPPPAP